MLAKGDLDVVPRWRAVRRPTLLLVVALGAAAGCRNSMAKIEKVRSALASGEASAVESATSDLPKCIDAGAPPSPCLGELATALGSKAGFRFDPPDQASAAAAAVVLVRERHAEWLPPPDGGWLTAVATGAGAGADALRLAIAHRMVEASSDVARSIDDETQALALVRGVAAAIPGACPAYALVGAGIPDLPPEMTADHSPCVQKDLERPGAPGGRYGHGAFRAAEGASAVWREAVRALRAGLAKSEGDARTAVERDVTALESGLALLALKKLPPEPDWTQFMTPHEDAGVPVLPRSRASGAANARDGRGGAGARGSQPSSQDGGPGGAARGR